MTVTVTVTVTVVISPPDLSLCSDQTTAAASAPSLLLFFQQQPKKNVGGIFRGSIELIDVDMRQEERSIKKREKRGEEREKHFYSEKYIYIYILEKTTMYFILLGEKRSVKKYDGYET